MAEGGERVEPAPRLLEGDQVLTNEESKLASLEQAAQAEQPISLPPTPDEVEETAASVEAVGLSEDAGHDLRLDQATFFRCVEDGTVESLQALLKNRKLDVNAYNDDGMTALHLAVYKYEQFRNLSIAETLIKHGANVCLKAAGTPSTHRISIIRHDSKNLGVLETRKVDFHQKPALLVALELKSSLYLKGWEYRHWDDMLTLLAQATVQHYEARGMKEPLVHQDAIHHMIQRNWKNVFESGKHELVEVWAESKHINALKLLLAGASKILKINIESSSRVDIKDASYNIVRAMVEFLYTGWVDPELLQQRGIDLFVAAHKYGVDSLRKLCEASIAPHPDNWIKLLTVATECNSDVLAWKCAKSIIALMDRRRQSSGTHLRHSFSTANEAPEQLFRSGSASSG